MYDIIVIGAGPAGLTAALYARRANKSVLVLEKGAFGGQITFSPRVENIPGFESVTGNEFAESLVSQVIAQGGEIEPAEALAIIDGEYKTVVCDSENYDCRAVIIATGAKHRLPGIDGEVKYIGNGISFCAVCDGAFYEGKTVAVLGGGNSAMQEALLLSDLCKQVYVIQNLDTLTGEQRLRDQLEERENVSVILGSVITALHGEGELDRITIHNAEADINIDIDVDGLFVAIGLEPQNAPFAEHIKLNSFGYADSDESCTTDTVGIFVAGDCRQKRIRQVATAASDGAVAALAACDYIDELK